MFKRKPKQEIPAEWFEAINEVLGLLRIKQYVELENRGFLELNDSIYLEAEIGFFAHAICDLTPANQRRVSILAPCSQYPCWKLGFDLITSDENDGWRLQLEIATSSENKPRFIRLVDITY